MKRETDSEYVERIRRGTAQWARWRKPMIVFHGILLVVCSVLWIVFVLAFVSDPDKMFPGIQMGFAIGAMLGATCGTLIAMMIVNLLAWVDRGGRCHRLMLKYHDALTELASGRAGEDVR